MENHQNTCIYHYRLCFHRTNHGSIHFQLEENHRYIYQYRLFCCFHRTIQSTQTHQNEQHLTNDTQQVAQVFGFVYTGTVPSYIQPKLKSNVKIIRNAICSVCLAGEVNMSLKHKTLDVSFIASLLPYCYYDLQYLYI